MKKLFVSLSLVWLVLGLVGFYLAEAYSLAGVNNSLNNSLGMYQSSSEVPKIYSADLQRPIKPLYIPDLRNQTHKFLNLQPCCFLVQALLA